MAFRAQRRAIQAVEAGLAASRRNGDNFYDAELWRLKGELVKTQGQNDGSRVLLSNCPRNFPAASRKISRVARLWQQQGKPTEARQVLSETYAWFAKASIQQTSEKPHHC